MGKKSSAPPLPNLVPLPDAPQFGQLPEVQGLTPQELQAIQQSGATLGQIGQLLSSEHGSILKNRNMLQQFSGLFDETGNINQQAVADLRNRIMAQQAQEDAINSQAVNYMASLFANDPYLQQSNQLGNLEAQRYEQALRGQRPVGASQIEAEKQRFELLKEAAGRKGIKLDGDDVFTATSDSTAGNQLLSRLRTEATMARQAEADSAINQGAAQNMARLGFGLQRQGQMFGQAQNLMRGPGASQLGYANSAAQMSSVPLAGAMGGLAQGYMGLGQPYADQRNLQYQNTLANSNIAQQNAMNQYNNRMSQVGQQNDWLMLNYQRQLQNQANRNARFGSLGGLAGGLMGLGLAASGPGALNPAMGAFGFGAGSGIGSGLFQSV